MLNIRRLREEKGYTQDDMVAKTGIPKRSYVDYESGKADIKISILQKIATTLGTSVSTIIGETKNEKNVVNLKDHNNDHANDQKRKVEKKYTNDNQINYSDQNKIPLYDGVVVAGQTSIADMSHQTRPIGYINAGDWFKDATGAMQVYDDSMKEYPTGCYVCFREIQDKLLIVFGQDYVVETTEYRVIKKIQRSEKLGFIILASTNQDCWEQGSLKGRMIHEPFDVPVDSIEKLCRVLGTVNRKESIYFYN